MAKRPTVSSFTSNNGTRYLFLNGGAFRSAFNALNADAAFTMRFPELANFAKIAVMQRPGGAVRVAVKPTSTSTYSDVHAETIGEDARRAIAERLMAPLAGENTWHNRLTYLITAILRFGEGSTPACIGVFDDLFGKIAADDADAKPAAVQPVPPHVEAQPAKATDWAGTPVPTPAPAKPAPSALASFGALGDAIRADIDAAVAVAIEAAPKASATVVTITVPGYTPVTMPEGEVVHESFARLLFEVTAQKAKDRNALLLGPRGSGKTHAAEQVARSLGLAFDAVSMSGGTTERAFWGSTTIKDGNLEWKPSRFVEMFATGGVFLIDELDKADPTVVTALNMATSNGYICPVDAPGRIDRHRDFICIACANALNADRAYTASARPDASSLDRFARITWDYSPAITTAVAGECGNATHADWLVRLSDALRARIESKGWRGEVEWGTRSIARVASRIRGGKTRTVAVEWEIDTMPANIAAELRAVANGIV